MVRYYRTFLYFTTLPSNRKQLLNGLPGARFPLHSLDVFVFVCKCHFRLKTGLQYIKRSPPGKTCGFSKQTLTAAYSVLYLAYGTYPLHAYSIIHLWEQNESCG